MTRLKRLSINYTTTDALRYEHFFFKTQKNPLQRNLLHIFVFLSQSALEKVPL